MLMLWRTKNAVQRSNFEVLAIFYIKLEQLLQVGENSYFLIRHATDIKLFVGYRNRWVLIFAAALSYLDKCMLSQGALFCFSWIGNRMCGVGQKKAVTLNTRGCTCICTTEHESTALHARDTHGCTVTFASVRSRRNYWYTRARTNASTMPSIFAHCLFQIRSLHTHNGGNETWRYMRMLKN